MEVRSVGIVGVGSYVPERVLTNQDLERMVETSDEWIKTRTGISTRHMAADNEATSDLGYQAAQAALADAGITAQELDLIIVATCTPDMLFPSTACLVQEKLGAKGVAAFDLEAACAGFIYGVVAGAQFIASGLYQNVLVIGAETMTRVLDWQDRNTCVLFGDGAGAAVLQPVPDGKGILSSDMGADGSGGKLLCVPAGGAAVPATHESVDARMHYLHMAGKEVFKFAVRAMGDAALKSVEKAGLSKDDIDLVVPHQANMRIVEAAMHRLKLPMEKAMINLDKYGNMSSASIPVALDEAYRQNRIKEGDNILMVGFGAGLTWGSLILKWGK